MLLSCDIALGANGLLVAWESRLGPALVQLASPSALKATGRYLGRERDGAVEVDWTDGKPAVLYTQSDGTHLHAGSFDDVGFDERSVGSAKTPPRVFDAASPIDVADGWVAGATSNGLVCGQPNAIRLVSGRTDVTHLRVRAVQGGALVVFGTPSSLGVLQVSSSGDAVREVLHALPSPIVSLDAASVGGRVAVIYADGRQLFAAEFGGDGRVRERPHVVLRGCDAGPYVTWMDSRFVYAGQTERGVRIHDGEGRQISFVELRGPYSLAYYRGRFLAAQLEDREGNHVLVLQSWKASGGHGDKHEVPCVLARTAVRRRLFAAQRLFEQLRDGLGAAGYREYRGGSVDARALRARVRVDDQALQLSVDVDSRGAQIKIDFASDVEDPPARSLVRLARFIRGLSSKARAEREAIRASVRAIVGDRAEVDDVDRTKETLSFTLRVEELPSAHELARWLRALSSR